MSEDPVEAALRTYLHTDPDLFSLRESMQQALAAYEAALWRPATEAPFEQNVIACDSLTSYEAVRLPESRRWVTRSGQEVFPTHFRPLPAALST